MKLANAARISAWGNALTADADILIYGCDVAAQADGKDIIVQIGARVAQINSGEVALEKAAYLKQGRTIVPLSFIRESLSVDVEYDPATGHVLITSLKK